MTKKPTEKIGNTLYYSAVKTYYDENGNISEEKKQINSIGESEKFSSEKTEYDIFGRVVLRSVNTNDDGRCNITQYYYESNNSSPSRIYTGQPFPLDISGLDEIKNIGYYIDNSDNYISGIPGNTTVLNFLNELKAGFGAAAVSDSRDNALSETDTVATGYNVVFDTEPSTKYTAIVSADINCDGFVNILDLVRFKKHLAGAVTLSQIQRKAADLNFNSQLTADDLILIRKTLLGCALPSFIPVPECSVQSFKYDTDGNITEYTDALGNSDVFEYDEFTGNPVSKTLRNGKVIAFEYDLAGNLIKTTGSEQGAPSVTYSYEYDLNEYQDFNLVVALPNGRPCENRIIEKEFLMLKEKAGLPNVVFHSLRHSSTTYKLKLNHGDLKATQGDTGHAEIDMITKVYAHILDEDRKINAQKFESAFYSNPDLRKVAPPQENAQPASIDLTALIEQLQKSPELANTLASIIAGQTAC